MKSVIKNQEDSEDIYPYLGETKWADSKNIVVLFSEEGKGLVIYSKDSVWRVGEYCSSWDMEVFRPFNGTIELSNN